MSPSPPVLHLDESGNTGEHLTDPEQPIFTLGAVHLDAPTAARLTAVLADDGPKATTPACVAAPPVSSGS